MMFNCCLIEGSFKISLHIVCKSKNRISPCLMQYAVQEKQNKIRGPVFQREYL